MKVVMLCSGGVDSVTAAALLMSAGHAVQLLHVNYGQRTFEAEARATQQCASHMRMDRPLQLNVPTIEEWGSGSLFVSESIQDLFPHRNQFLISLASVVASKIEATAVGIGVIDVNNAQLADCRPPFLKACQNVLSADNPALALLTPLADLTKVNVVRTSLNLGVPLTLTFSCNRLSHRHCWTCSGCLERKLAFEVFDVDL